MKNIDTTFPSKVDMLRWYHDLQVDGLDTYNTFKNYINKKEYRKASESLQNSEVDYYGAYAINFINRRLRAIEQNMNTRTKPDQVIYQATEPTTYKKGSFWIS